MLFPAFDMKPGIRNAWRRYIFEVITAGSRHVFKFALAEL